MIVYIHALREEGDGKLEAVSVDRENFYPRPPRGGRPKKSCSCTRCHSISIHALREEGDFFGPAGWPLLDAFLSTPSARRATDFVPVLLPEELISIHALREEGDGSM